MNNQELREEFDALLIRPNRPSSAVDVNRMWLLYQFATRARGLEGDAIEIGVYKGGSAVFISKALGPGKKLYLLDTFTGLPCLEDKIKYPGFGHHKESFNDTSIEDVNMAMTYFGLPNYRLIPGDAAMTLPELKLDKFCFVHIDGDLSYTARVCLEYCWPRLVVGGALICDDYNWKATPGVTGAVNEYFADKIDFPIQAHKAQCFIIKMAG